MNRLTALAGIALVCASLCACASSTDPAPTSAPTTPPAPTTTPAEDATALWLAAADELIEDPATLEMLADPGGMADLMGQHAVDGMCGDATYHVGLADFADQNPAWGDAAQYAWGVTCLTLFQDTMSDEMIRLTDGRVKLIELNHKYG